MGMSENSEAMLIGGGIELLTLLIQAIFLAAAQNGITSDQIDRIYSEEKIKFGENVPENLPDV